MNAQAGPSRYAQHAQQRQPSPKIETPSPINPVDDEPVLLNVGMGPGAGAGGAGGSSGGVRRNGLSVDENGEVTKVPAFLTKLYSMVSDEDTNELIHWSDRGDSFLIPNQELLAKKILPKFFKHSNFQSFVRQLNMYAFHKVPHNSATPTGEAELWEFINPLFKRGEPDLLGRITRRQRVGAPGVGGPGGMPISGSSNTGASSASMSASASGRGISQTQVISPGGSYHPIHLITDGTTQGEALNGRNGIGVGAGGKTGLNMIVSPQGVVDLSAITSGIAAIQRTQASIGADLKALQASNDHLWREAIEQREKHKKHQETIDLIVSFLERLFGTDGEGLKGLKEAMRRAGMGMGGEGGGGGGAGGGGGGTGGLEEIGGAGRGSASKKRRLGMDRMIGDGSEGAEGGGGRLVEINSGDKKSRFNDPFLPRPTRSRSSLNSSTTLGLGLNEDSTAAGRFTTLPSEGEPSPVPPSGFTSSSDRSTPIPGTSSTAGNGTGTGTGIGTGTGTVGSGMEGEYDPLALALAPYYPNQNQNQSQNRDLGVQGQSGLGLGYGQASGINGDGYRNEGGYGTGPTDGYDFFRTPANTNTNTDPATSQHQSQQPSYNTNLNLPPLSPASAQAASAFNLDPALLQTTIGSLLQSPAAAQMFLNSLKSSASAQGLNTNTGMGMGLGTGQNTTANNNNSTHSNSHSQYSDPTLALFNPLPSTPSANHLTTSTFGHNGDYTALKANQDELLRSYENALGVGEDVEGLQRGIDELVRSMGLDVGGVGGGVGGEVGGAGGMDGGVRGVGGVPTGGARDGDEVDDTSLDDIFGVGSGASTGMGTGMGMGDENHHNPNRIGASSSTLGQSQNQDQRDNNKDDDDDDDDDDIPHINPDSGIGIDLPEGFDVDQFLKDLEDEQAGQT